MIIHNDFEVTYQPHDAWVLLSLMLAYYAADYKRVALTDILKAGALLGGPKPSRNQIDDSFNRLNKGGWASLKDDGSYGLTYHSLNSWRGAVSHQPNRQNKLALVEQILGLREQEDWAE